MNCPLCHSTEVKLHKSYRSSYVIELYKKIFQVDISRLFHEIEIISVYCCSSCTYRFYYPFTIYGDGKFYEELQKFDWYYMSWKWEYEQAMGFVNDGLNILEIGCGNGSFLTQLQNTYKVSVTGLELNHNAIKESKAKNVRVLAQSIQKHAEQYKNHYDIVCCFQVLEHITDVRSFLWSALSCLKPSGKLIISTPNNDSFIKYDTNNALNLPPHHMGLWTAGVFKKLGNFFPMQLVALKIEPLQDYHVSWYVNIMLYHYLRSNFMLKVTYKLKVNQLVELFIVWNKNKIKGHTVLAVFEK